MIPAGEAGDQLRCSVGEGNGEDGCRKKRVEGNGRHGPYLPETSRKHLCEDYGSSS